MLQFCNRMHLKINSSIIRRPEEISRFAFYGFDYRLPTRGVVSSQRVFTSLSMIFSYFAAK